MAAAFQGFGPATAISSTNAFDSKRLLISSRRSLSERKASFLVVRSDANSKGQRNDQLVAKAVATKADSVTASAASKPGVECKCRLCGTSKMSLNDWEKHTGSKAKKWKVSIKVKGSILPLHKWLEKYNICGFNPSKLEKHQLMSFLQERYEPVHAKWIVERCAVCRCVEDYDYNRIMICNRCEIAVHQVCYGVEGDIDFASWVCRACETPNVERECCLCPVKGGALKPTDLDDLWVHVSCAWLRPEVAFLDLNSMEPASGILRIPASFFAKRCVICKQAHGACNQCCKCSTFFHGMCALRAGYFMELHCSEKDGIYSTRWTHYCAVHRVPSPENALKMQIRDGAHTSRSCIQNHQQDQCFRGSRLVSAKITENADSPPHLLRTASLSHSRLHGAGSSRSRIVRQR